MALPTSTIAMAVLTCIPFGLAIRDTVNGKGSERGSYERDDDSTYESAVAQHAAVEAELESERLERVETAARIKANELRSARRELFGAEVATLGSGFRSISLGMPFTEMISTFTNELGDAARVAIVPLGNGTLDMPLANGTLDRILIKPVSGATDDESAELCEMLAEDLQDAWGPGQTERYRNPHWVNPTTGTRASLSPEPCQLRIERFAAPKAWVNKTKTSVVPIWRVGQSVGKFLDYVPPGAELDDRESTVRWLGVGVGAGSGEARFEAYYAKGKVVAITVGTDTLTTTREDVIAQLVTMYGPALDDDNGMHWKSRPAIQLTDHAGAGVALTIGKLPPFGYLQGKLDGDGGLLDDVQ